MTQKSINVFMNETYSKPPKKKFVKNKTVVYYIINLWSVDIIDLKDYGPENKRGYRYASVVFDILLNFGWTVLFKDKNAQTIKDAFENFLITSKRKPKSFQNDGGEKIYITIFQNVLNKHKFNLYSINTSLVAVFAEGFNRTIRDLLKSLFLNEEMLNVTIFYLL